MSEILESDVFQKKSFHSGAENFGNVADESINQAPGIAQSGAGIFFPPDFFLKPRM